MKSLNITLFLVAVLGMNTVVGAVDVLADIDVLDAGDFSDLSVGAQAFYDPNSPNNVYKWLNLPSPLDIDTLDYWLNANEPSHSASWEYGLAEFEVLTSGPVWMLVTTRFGGGGNSDGDWEQELSTQAELEADGWAQIASNVTISLDAVNANFECLLYERQSIAGESFSLRTEKYIAPILLIPEPATLGLLLVGGLALLRRRRLV